MEGRRQLAAVVCIVGAALLIRCAAMWGLHASEHALETAYEHHVIARCLVEGRGFSFNFFGPPGAMTPTSQQAPLVPAILAGWYWLLGTGSVAALRGMLLTQLAASAATVLIVAWFARDVSGSARQGWTAGILACCYPPMIISALHVQALVWNLLWLMLLAWGAEKMHQTSCRAGRYRFLIAAVFGLLTDPILVVAIAALLCGVLWRGCGQCQRRIVAIAAMGAAIAVGIAPWTYRNYLVHGRLMLIKDSFGYVFWQGNHPQSFGTDKLLVKPEDREQLVTGIGVSSAAKTTYSARRHAISIDSVLNPEERAQLAALPDEISRMDFFAAQGAANLRTDPALYLSKCARRLWYWVWFDATNPRTYLWHYRMSYLSVCALAAIGAILEFQKGGLPRWWTIWHGSAALTAVHVLIITSARFRIPLEMLLLPIASTTIMMAGQWLRRSQRLVCQRTAVGRSTAL